MSDIGFVKTYGLILNHKYTRLPPPSKVMKSILLFPLSYEILNNW